MLWKQLFPFVSLPSSSVELWGLQEPEHSTDKRGREPGKEKAFTIPGTPKGILNGNVCAGVCLVLYRAPQASLSSSIGIESLRSL